MAQSAHHPQPAQPETFIWHPDHRGHTTDEVFRDLRDELERDQRQYQLALDGAEHSESNALASVLDLDRRWGPYEMDWAAAPPDDLAQRIVAFEYAREQRQEMISYSAWRDEVGAPASVTAGGAGNGGSLVPMPVVVAGAIAIILLIFLLIVF